MRRVQPRGALGRIVGRPLFWVAAMAIVVGVPLVRSVIRGLPPAPPRLGAVTPPDAALAGRPYLAAAAADVDALVALHRRLAKLGDSFSIVVVGGAVPPGHSPRIWHAVARAPALVAGGGVALVDGAGQLRGRYDPRDPAARDALVAAVGLLVNTDALR